MEQTLLRLQTDAWRTSSARYNAARRLNRREIFATASLALFSAASVFLAFVQRVLASSDASLGSYLTLLSACLGIFLLAISLIEWGARASAKSDQLHRNAEELNSLRRKIGQRAEELRSTGGGIDWSGVESLRIEYESIKQRCEANHLPVDDAAFRARHRSASEFSGDKKMTWGEATAAKILYAASSVWYFAVLWLVFTVALYMAPWPKDDKGTASEMAAPAALK